MLDVTYNTPCFFTQQLFLIGTRDEDGSPRFAPISWVSYTQGEPACLIISIRGTKHTKDNIVRNEQLSATVVTPDLLPLAEQFNKDTYNVNLMKKLDHKTEKGKAVDVPLLVNAKFSYECEVIHTVHLGDTHTYFAAVKQINMREDVAALDWFNLNAINPVVYSPNHYFTVGTHLGAIGDFSK